ncbi:LysR family transcriptional regulator [Streptomyces olivaceiscleroticus]|uniref:HTH lysR-type domain-containing protein n=1 Tax=Streptomyces olivaceiscleroticus TaxID=68245 RepID=A0ABN0ZL61_9ACTN
MSVPQVPERLEIDSFVILVEEPHFGRTAKRLRVSRARVSQTIQRLECRIGAPLFERTSRRVRLTPLGRQFLDDIEPGYRAITRGLATAQAAAKGIEGSLTVGPTPFPRSLHLPPGLLHLAVNGPGVGDRPEVAELVGIDH